MSKKVSSIRRSNDRSIRDKAYLHIQRKIALGELQQGSALSELALAKELGISRTPIREAIGQLIAEGLLEQSPSRGTVVVKLTRQDIVDLYELREALEIYAVAKAARQTNKDTDIQRLQALADEVLAIKNELHRSGKPALDPMQMHSFIASDLAFHTLLMHLAANARMLKIVKETRLLIRIFAMRHQGHDEAELERIHRQHRELVSAVAEIDADRAVRVIMDHLQASRQERLDAYDQWERESSLRELLPSFYDMNTPAGSHKH
jgi:DNA-binding GntR family transcriptional regulator